MSMLACASGVNLYFLFQDARIFFPYYISTGNFFSCQISGFSSTYFERTIFNKKSTFINQLDEE
jgi:hypothetical protein